MNKLKTFTALAIIAIIHASGFAQADSAAIYFRQSKTALIPSYKDNGKSLNRLAEELQDTTLALRSHVTVVGSASPEGTISFNNYLSHKRAERILNYFSSRNVINGDSTTFIFTGRNWAGLKQMVENDPEVPSRDKVLSLLDDIVSDNYTTDSDAVTALKKIDGGIPYLYMYHHLFPSLRSAWIFVDYRHPAPAPAIIHSSTPPTLVPDYTPLSYPAIEIPYSLPHRKPFYMALKTNMLYDALAIPSIGAEFYLGKNISIVGNWAYGWWKTDRKHYYWRAYGGDIALRWWFGEAAHRKPLTGHHLGIYGGILTYDFELGGEGVMGGKPGRTLWDRYNTTAGIEYGYSLPVGRRINIDFTIGIGYMGGEIVKYTPQGNHYLWKSNERLTWVGPTKAEISLVWLIGAGNYNQFNRKASK